MANVSLELKLKDLASKPLGDVTKASDGLKTSLDQVSNVGKNLQSLGGNLTKSLSMPLAAITAVVNGSLGAMVNSTIQYADSLQVAEHRTGLQVEQFQALSYAAKRSGVEVNLFTTTMQRLQRRGADAVAGNQNLAAAFDELGVSLKDGNGNLRATADLLPEIADRFKAIENPGERARLAFRLFDTEGTKLLPFLTRGSAGIAELTSEAERLGIVMSGETVQGLLDFNNTLDQVKGSFAALRNNIVASFLPILQTQLVPFLEQTVIPSIAKLAKGISDAITWFAELPTPVRNTIAVLTAAAIVVPPLTTALGALISSFRTILTVLPLVRTAFLAMIAPPAGWILAAVAAITGVAIAFSGKRKDQLAGAAEEAKKALENEVKPAVDKVTESLTGETSLSAALLQVSQNLEGDAATAVRTYANEIKELGNDVLVTAANLALLPQITANAIAQAKARAAIEVERSQQEIANESIRDVPYFLSNLNLDASQFILGADGILRPIAEGILEALSDAQYGNYLYALKALQEDSAAIASSPRIFELERELAALVAEGEALRVQLERGVNVNRPGFTPNVSPSSQAQADLIREAVQPTSDWVRRLVDEVQVTGLKTAREAISLIQPERDRLVNELAALQRSGQFGTEAYQIARTKLDIVDGAINGIQSIARAQAESDATVRREANAQAAWFAEMERGRTADVAAQEAIRTDYGVEGALRRIEAEQEAAREQEALWRRVQATHEYNHYRRIAHDQEQARLAQESLAREAERADYGVEGALRRIEADQEAARAAENLWRIQQAAMQYGASRMEAYRLAEAQANEERIKGERAANAALQRTMAVEDERLERQAIRLEGDTRAVRLASEAADEAERLSRVTSRAESGSRIQVELEALEARANAFRTALASAYGEGNQTAVELLTGLLISNRAEVTNLNRELQTLEDSTSFAQGIISATDALTDIQKVQAEIDKLASFQSALNMETEEGQEAYELLAQAIEVLRGKLTGLVQDEAAEKLQESYDKLRQRISEGADAGRALMAAIGVPETVLSGVDQLANGVSGVVEAAAKLASGDIFGGIMAGIKGAVSLIQGLVNLLTPAWVRVSRELQKQIMAGVVGGITSAVRDYVSGATDLKEFRENFKKEVYTGVLNGILDAVMQAAIIEGVLAPVIKQIADAAAKGDWDAVSKAIGSIPDLANEALDNLLPSLNKLRKEFKWLSDEIDDKNAEQDNRNRNLITASNNFGQFVSQAVSIPLYDASIRFDNAVNKFGGFVDNLVGNPIRVESNVTVSAAYPAIASY